MECECIVFFINFFKIIEIINRYFRVVGSGGIVFIDGIEYIYMYNGFDVMVKWLSII